MALQCGANVDDVFAVTDVDGLAVKCYLVLSIGAVSLFCCSAALSLFHKHRRLLGHPIVESLMYSLVLSIPSTLNAMTSALLRLSNTDSFARYCEISGFLTQQLEVPQLMLEAFFFSAIVWVMLGGTVTSMGVRRAFALAAILGTIGAFIPMATLPVKASTRSIYGASVPWCWLPTYDVCRNGEWQTSTMLVVYKLVFGYIWVFITIVVGALASGLILWYTRRHREVVIPASLRLRIAYYVIYISVWTLCLVPRYFGAFVPEHVNTSLEYVLAVALPGVPAMNALLFILIDGKKVIFRAAPGSAQALEKPLIMNAYDDMQSIIGSPHRRRQQTGGPSSPEDSRTDGGYDALAAETAADATLNSRTLWSFTSQPLLHGAAVTRESAAGATTQLQSLGGATTLVAARFDDENVQWIVIPHHHLPDEDRLLPSDATRRAAVTVDHEYKAFEAALRSALGPAAVIQNMAHLPKPPIGVALSLVAGYLDALSFITLDLFACHVTGNIVLVAVNLAKNDFGDAPSIVQECVAIVVFFLCITALHGTSFLVTERRRMLLFAEALLFLASFLFSYNTGPFLTDEQRVSWGGYMTAMLLVSGMAAQNSYQRSYLVGLPLTAFMTGNLNQVAHDVVDILRRKHRGGESAESLRPVLTRLRNTSTNILFFFIGCALATLAVRTLRMWAGMPPVLMVSLTLIIFWEETASPPPPSSKPAA